MASDLHDYIHNILEGSDQSPSRPISFDLATLNDVIGKHANRIAKHIESDVKKALFGGDERITVSALSTGRLGDEEKVTVQNYIGNVSFECIVSTPKTLDDLLNVMAKAKRENLNVKAVGSFHAWSPVCETTGYLINTDLLTGTSRTPTATLKDPSQGAELYDVSGGTKLKQLIQALEKDGRALMNLGGFTGQSITGATATGTHGSGLKLPPLASMICSVHLVSATFGANGLPIQYRIEPSKGISDPKKQPTSVVLIQDDETFNAVVTGLGAFGVIYAVTITTVPFYWIRQLRQMVDWPTAKQLLQQGPDGDILKYHNAEVWINPYTSKTLITRREKTTQPGDGQTDSNSGIFATLLMALPALRAVTDIFDWTNVVEEVSEDLGNTLAAFLMHFPLLLPTVIDIALDTQNHSEPKVAKYYDIYDIGFASYFPVISTEISYPTSTYVSATESTISLLQKLRGQDIFAAIASPLSLRFTASTPASLSMSYSANPSQSSGRCYLEIFSLFHFYQSIQGYDKILRPISEQSVNAHQGRLHWGQYITPPFTSRQYKAHDPEFFASIASFKRIAEKFDPGSLMSNSFMYEVIWSAVENRSSFGCKWM